MRRSRTADGKPEQVDRRIAPRSSSGARTSERPALEVHFSNQAASDSIRYAAFLLADKRNDVAEAVLIDAQDKGNGRIAGARDFLDAQLQENPETPTLLVLRAGVHRLERLSTEAATLYRSVLKEFLAANRPLQALHRSLLQRDCTNRADALIDSAIAADHEARFA